MGLVGVVLFGLCSVLVKGIGAEISLEERLGERLAALAAFDSRVTGYSGAAAAADWLEEALHRSGVEDTYRQNFSLPVPVDEGFWLDSGQLHLPLHGMWPNLVRTSTLPERGIEGVLVYGGEDPLAVLEGEEIAGRILLLEYGCGIRWLGGFGLGAAAVIFLPPEQSHRKEAMLKFLDVPAPLPRLYAPESVAGHLRALANERALVRLSGRMPWHLGQGVNLIGIIKGRDPVLRGEAVLLGAHYDSMSPVPALAPGAEQSGGAAALLELAQVLAAQPLRRTVILVFCAGHYQQLAGMRHLVPVLRAAAQGRGGGAENEPVFRALQGLRLRLFVGLDLSSGSDKLGVFRPVAPYRTQLIAPPLSGRLMALAAAYEDSALSGARILANGLKQDFARQGLGSVAETMPLGASAAALAGCPSVAFATINDNRWRTDSPLDKIDGVSLPALARQVDFLVQVFTRLVDDPQLEPWEWGNDGFGVLAGEVVHYGPRSYLPDQPTGGALVRVRLRQPTLMGVRGDYWAVADESGRFVVPGVESGIIYTQPVRVEAYGIDPISGAVVAAPDWGISGQRRLPGRVLQVLMDDLEEEVQIVTTSVASLTLFEPFDPRNLLSLEQIELIDAEQAAEPVRFGAVMPLTPPEVELFSYKNRLGSWIGPAVVLFAEPGSRIKAIMATGRFGLGRRLLLLNSDSTDPEGRGFLVEEEVLLTSTAYQVARDMEKLNGGRIANLEGHGVRNGRLAAFQRKAEALLAEADEARAEHRHRFFLDRARMAWAYGAAAYREVERTQGGVVQGALFLLAMLLPFAHFAERLFCGFAQLRRQVLGYFAFFAAGFFALNYLHPAFELAISPAVILLGFVILTLSILVSWIGIGRLNRELYSLVQGRRSHRDVRRSSALFAAVAVGLAHLKRRPLRTGLTCSTLVLLTFSVLSFTSMRAALRTNWIATGQKANYEGALVRLPGWKTMEMGAYWSLVERYGAGCAPRSWLGVGSLAAPFRLEREDDSHTAVGILGLAGLGAQEIWLTKPQQSLVAGRWLAPGERDACLLPRGVADSLKIGTDELDKVRIRLFGELFRVVGLFGDGGIEAVDLNGAPLTPLDPESQQPSEAAVGPISGGRTPVFTHLSGSVTAVFPFEALMRWEGARLVGVAVPMEDPARQLAELAEVVDLNLFAGRGGQRYLVNTVGVTSVAGWTDLLVPLGIAALIVLNTMLGAVYERRHEIGTFNAVGLAPTHVSLLFIGEACAFGVIGAVLGYLLGQGAAQGAAHWGWLAGLELNYSSLSAVTTMGAVMGMVVLSALYPARLAARLCTPGIERRWHLPLPEGHQLQLRLPFVLGYRDAMGMAAFQAEFWDGHREQSIGAGFYVEALEVKPTKSLVQLGARVWLAPFDRGVVQDVELDMVPDPEGGYYHIDLRLDLVEGDFDTWRRVSRTFVDDLRKQFLLWRTLSDQERQVYIVEMEERVDNRADGGAGMGGPTRGTGAKGPAGQEA